ncbi:MAG TPA: FhaA domain-containing protein [Candidatus Rubrimentiphilum sp.]|nr:FhaA domain-containing protein [Candidatus Rubrimentiphilum sp.]
MSFFGRVEEACAAFVERAFANMFPSDLEPAQIARKLVATMEARTRQTDNVTVAPAHYTVYVHAADYERLAPHRAYLEGEWSALLADVAERVGISFETPPRAELREGSEMVAGAVEIATEADDEARDRSAYVLRMLGGIASESEFRINGAARVGRSPESDVHLPDPSVSRNHALVDVQNGSLVVHDAGSTNGTYVNRERIDSAVLKAGDVVAFGKAELRVEQP